MKSKDRNHAKEHYRELRDYSWERLWREEVPRFDALPGAERERNVAVVRAVGVVFGEFEAHEDKEAVRSWLAGLLRDPSEKVRRYAMAALPKVGADAKYEEALLSVLQNTTEAREKKFALQAVEKIGGRAALSHGLRGGAEQKIKAGVARREHPSALRMQEVLSDFAGVQIHLRGRDGLERFIRDEVEQTKANGTFRVGEIQSGCVTVVPLAPFSLADIYELRCFDRMALVLGEAANESTDALADIIAAPFALRLFRAMTGGVIRYRLNFAGKGHQRAAIASLAEAVYARCPEILNDGQDVTWTVDIFPKGAGRSVELRPNVTPDPRFSYRQKDVPPASHPPLAAALARLGEARAGDVVWDPFCGSGLELIESARFGAGSVIGSDLSAEALQVAQNNFNAAKLESVSAKFVRGDFREAERSIGPGSVSLIVTNPPMGRRVPVGDLKRLIADLFDIAATVLKPGGRFVLVNPLTVDRLPPALKRQLRQKVDLGGFECRVEKYLKSADR